MQYIPVTGIENMSYSRLSQGFTYLFILTFHCWVIIFSIQVVGVYYHELCFLFLLNCIIQLSGGKNGYDFKSVRRWTSQKKLGYCLLECDKVSCMPYIVFIYYLFVLFCFVLFYWLFIGWFCQSSQIFVPIHKEVHWCLAVINKKDEKFQYLDSLRGIDSHVLKVLVCSVLKILVCWSCVEMHEMNLIVLCGGAWNELKSLVHVPSLFSPFVFQPSFNSLPLCQGVFFFCPLC